MLQNLPVKDVNNVHLVCRNLHQIANLHVNPILRLKVNSPEDLESLVKSSRIFRELKFGYDGDEDEDEEISHSIQFSEVYLVDPEKFEMLEKFIRFTGPHMKNLLIKCMNVDQKFFQLLLNLMPNKEVLELDNIKLNDPSDGPIKWALKPSKMKRILIDDCAENFESLLESLETCVIEEAKLGYTSSKEQEIMEKFLKSQEKNLKKLTIETGLNVPSNLKDLRLEYLEFSYQGIENISLEFLTQQTDLKVLKINASLSSQDISMICELKQLEILELRSSASESSGLNKLYQLEKLKRLTVSKYVCRNILEHLKFGTFEDLEELDARFEDASVESIQEMKRITPNLRKIEIQYVSSDTINAFLESLENLESVEIYCENWEISSEKVLPNMKHLEVYSTSCFEINVAQLTHQFPNLEFLKIVQNSFAPTEPFSVTLLSGLKRLKTLEMDIRSETKIDSEFVLPCFEKYGSHLETVQVRAVEKRNLMKEPHGVIGFAINKKPNESFCFKQILDDIDDDFD